MYRIGVGGSQGFYGGRCRGIEVGMGLLGGYFQSKWKVAIGKTGKLSKGRFCILKVTKIFPNYDDI